MSMLPEWLGTIPGWITAATSSGILGVAALVSRHMLRDKELDNESGKTTRADDRAEIAELRKEMRALRKEMEDQRHACIEEQNVMQGQISKLHEEVAGLRRQNAADQIAFIRAAPSASVNPEIAAAVERLDRIP